MRWGWLAVVGFGLSGAAPQVPPPPNFTEVLIGPAGPVQATAVELGDYDHDGDLDLAVASVLAGNTRATRLYKYDGAAFAHDTSAVFPGVTEGPFIFGDYDRDGDLDVLLSGVMDGGFANSARVGRNDGPGGFTAFDPGLIPVKGADARWFDADNDGDLDFLLGGERPPTDHVTLYRNNGGGAFAPILDFPGIYLGQIDVGDYDRDGDVDLAITGRSNGSRVYRNDGGHFIDLNLALVPVDIASTVAWGDYDNDGDLDFILSGINNLSSVPYCEIYRNDGGDVFTALGAGLPGLVFGDIDWGDYDNDGDLDLLYVGVDALLSPNPVTRVYRNDAGVFVDAALALAPGIVVNSGAWGDYDNDGDLDIFLASNAGVKAYRNDSTNANPAPAAPSGLSATLVGSAVEFQWTSSPALSYHLRVGSTPGGQDIMADSFGLPAPGQGPVWTLRGLAPGTYYYSAQAVDAAFQRSAWAVEQNIVVPPAIRVLSSSLVPPTLTLTFDRAPDPATVDATSVRLTRSGVPVAPTSLSLVGAVLTLGLPLPSTGAYELRVSGTPAPPVSHAGLYAHWRLDEGMGTSTSDASGNGHAGTLVGAGWTSGLFGAAGSFNGGAQRIEVGSGVLPQPWTAGMWVRRQDSAGIEAALMDCDTGQAGGTSLRLEQFFAKNRAGFTTYGVSDPAFNYTMPENEWMHLTYVGIAGVVILFVNGVEQDAIASLLALQPQRLGGHSAAALKGALDEVQVYGRALSRPEIAALAAPTAFVRGTDGRALDGDGNGVAGGDFVQVFSVGGGFDDRRCGLLGPELLLLLLLRRRR